MTADPTPRRPVRIGRFRWWHVADVLPIEADLFGVEQWSAAMFWNELANRHHYLVATDGPDGPVLGYAGLAVQPPDEAWVQNIAVRRDAQRRGVGRALLEALLAEADARRVRAVLLEVAVDNAPAQKLYAAYDFEPVGIRRGYYQPTNTDALVMRRARD
ncbi:ribosomal protein S18-alanine N-acetyltransferase [Micromonospora sp. WMMD882]|uniref:ribosomal protein S18-alanine N-acetyltransferase n=1 Tax=Micromonospora sp. WMMD882 TaxID=3015151 RepID=UPI00248AFC9A|nr:ribosomal protein S18-alanine N-acetyltransferase [Micromonospora sp. WMMD882]WBB79224.1 ribosomal protein S18-alanine N-acetyltransferase [Micromonospora sp. WMMD882]